DPYHPSDVAGAPRDGLWRRNLGRWDARGIGVGGRNGQAVADPGRDVPGNLHGRLRDVYGRHRAGRIADRRRRARRLRAPAGGRLMTRGPVVGEFVVMPRLASDTAHDTASASDRISNRYLAIPAFRSASRP